MDDLPAFLPLPEKYANPHRRNDPGYFANLQKKVYLGPYLSITGEDVAEALKTGEWLDRERFADSLPGAVCYEGLPGMRAAFTVWMEKEKQKKK